MARDISRHQSSRILRPSNHPPSSSTPIERILHSHPLFFEHSTRNQCVIQRIRSYRRKRSSKKKKKIKKKKNKNGEEMGVSFCRFSRAIRFLPNSQSFWELYRKIQKRNGRLSLRFESFGTFQVSGKHSSKAPRQNGVDEGGSFVRPIPSFMEYVCYVLFSADAVTGILLQRNLSSSFLFLFSLRVAFSPPIRATNTSRK